MLAKFRRCVAAALVWQVSSMAAFLAADEFKPLFNGKDLSGWVNVNCAPETFVVQDGMIVTTGVPTGILRTDKQYENFILELEWRHMKAGGNSGLFVWSDALPARGTPFSRAVEVQVMDGPSGIQKIDGKDVEVYTTHGDVFSIQGATCKPDRPHPTGGMRCLPSEKRSKPSPEWNHYRVECKDGAIKLAVNGKVVSGVSECSVRKGYICLEAEGSECHFRNIRIQELPGGNASPDQVADVAQGFVPLYNGLNLAGWKDDPGHAGHWKPNNWILSYDGKSEAAEKDLWTEKEYGDFELICDWRLPAEPKPTKRPIILPDGNVKMGDDGKPVEVEVPDAGDSGIFLRGSSKSQINIWCWPVGSGEVYGYRTDASQSPEVRAGVTPKVKADRPLGQWNRFHVTMRGQELTVVLNGQTVLDKAQLPGVPPKGKIALQHHGDPVQFANIFIRELESTAK